MKVLEVRNELIFAFVFSGLSSCEILGASSIILESVALILLLFSFPVGHQSRIGTLGRSERTDLMVFTSSRLLGSSSLCIR